MISETLQRARKSIPACCFKCNKGCYECCTSIEFTKEEKVRMDALLLSKGYTEPPAAKGEKYCEYLNEDGQCSVYEERPVICQAYGCFRIPTLMCTYKREEIAKTDAPLDFTPEVMDYFQEVFSGNNAVVNKGGRQVRSELDPVDQAILEGKNSILGLVYNILMLYKNFNISEEKFQDSMVKLEQAMVSFHNDSIANHFPIKLQKIEGEKV